MADSIDEFLDSPSSDHIDAFLDTPTPEESEAKQKASRIYSEVREGLHPNMTEEELLPIVKLASQDEQGNPTTPFQRLGKQAGNVLSLITNPMQAAPIGADLAKQAWEGAKGVATEAGENASGAIPTYKTEKTLAAGAVGDTGSFLGGTAINASAGTANLISEAAEKITGQKYDDPDLTNARAAIMEGKMNRSIKGAATSIGVDPESSTYHAGGLIGQALIPIGGEVKAAGVVAKTAEGLAKNVPKVAGVALEKTAQVAQNKFVQSGVAAGTGHLPLAAGILAELAAEKIPGGIGRFFRTWRTQAMDATLGRIEDLGTALRGSPDAETITGALLSDARQVVAKNEARIADRMATKGLTPESDVFKKHGEEWLHPEESLPKNEREIRQILIENENQAKKIRQLEGLNDYNKVASYAGKLGLTSAGNIAVGAGIGGIIGGINAQPGDDESAKRMVVMMGAFAAPFAPIHASRALKEMRAEAGREAFREIGKDSIGSDHPNYDAHQQAYNGLTPEGKDAIDVAAGMLKSMGGKGVVILPKEEFLKVQGGDASKAPGRGFVRDGTIYLNGEHAPQGVLGHELAHFLPQALGQSAFEIIPGLKEKMAGKNTSQDYKDFESYYNSLSPEKGNIPEEVLAETGRRILTDMPPELFYGGASGADVLKRWGGKILGKIAPEWYQKNNIDPVLKAPISKADEAAVRARLFEIGERRGQEPPRNVPDEPSATTIPPDPSKAATEPTVSAETPTEAPAESVPPDIAKALKKKGFTDEQIAALSPDSVEIRGVKAPEVATQSSVSRMSPPETLSASESSLAQAKAPTEGQSAVAKVPPAPVPIVETPPQSEQISVAAHTNKESPLPSENVVASPEIKAETPIVSSEKENPMLIGPRTDKYGRKSVSGRIFDPAIKEHAALAEKAGLDEVNIAKLRELSDKMGETVGIDYSHAPEEGLGRKESQKKTLAQARIEGAKREKLSKTFVPTWIEFTSGTNKAVIRGFSPDKFYENVSRVFKDHPEVMEPYSGVNDPKITQDFQHYAENHANGYTGMGKPIEGTELTPIKQNHDYKPHVIPEDRANVINLLMGDTSAAEGVRKASPVKLEKRALAKANAPFFDSETGETNKIRAVKGDMGLESVSETLRPELIDKIREPYVEDVHTIRPSGAAPESRASLAKAGTPNSTYVASGFFPEPEPFKGKTIEAGEPPWSIRLKELQEQEWQGKKKLTPPEEDELLELHKKAREEYGSYGNWFEKMGAEKDYISRVFGDEKQKPTQFMPGPSQISWMDRSGNLQSGKDHEPMARRVTGKEGDDAFRAMFDLGQARIVVDGHTLYYNTSIDGKARPLTPSQRKAIEVLAQDKSYNVMNGDTNSRDEALSFKRPDTSDAPTWDELLNSWDAWRKGEGKDRFMPAPHIEREAERLGLQYKGTMGDNGELILFNDPITKSTISIKADAEKGALQEKLKASREKFGANDKTGFMPGDTKNLVALHNLSSEKLRHADRMGGLALPSIAITRIDQAPFTGFGDISLVGSPELIKPSRDMRVLNADAYSTRYPSVKHFLDAQSQNKLRELVGSSIDEVPKADKSFSRWSAGSEIEDRGLVEGLKHDANMQLAYLVETGQKVPKLTGNQQSDHYEIRKKVDYDTAEATKYHAWLEDKAASLNAHEKIFTGFTNAGNRKYLEHNLDTVVRLMKKEWRDGEGFNYGAGSVRSRAAKQFKSIKSIQDSRGDIISPKALDAIKDSASNELTALADEIMPLRSNSVEGFGKYDAFSDDLAALADGGSKNWQYIREQYGDHPEAVNEMRAFLDKLRALPTEYFEAKAKRAVGLHEFTGAVVPNGMDAKIISLLEKRGLDVREYDKGDPESRRKAVEDLAREHDSLFMPDSDVPIPDKKPERKIKSLRAVKPPERKKKRLSDAR